MDKLSNLIKEAKPLYKQKQRQKSIARLIFSICTPVMLFTSIFQLYMAGENIYVALEKDSIQMQLLEDDLGLLGL